MGHVVRCLALAEELRDNYSCNISFAMRKSELGINKVKIDYPVLISNENDRNFVYENWLLDCIGKTKSKVLVLDVRDGLGRESIKRIKDKTGIKIVTIDDSEDKRLEADLAFYPPVPQVKRMNWAGFNGKLYSGWEWVILRREFSEWKKKQNKESSDIQIPKILITAGGSDPMGLTLEIVRALNMLKMDFMTLIVLGPGFSYYSELNSLLTKASYPHKIFKNLSSMTTVMSQANLAIATFGMTAYELTVMGVPVIYISLTDDHAESASFFMDAGIAISLGVFINVTNQKLAGAVKYLIDDEEKRLQMSDKSKNVIDGFGYHLVAQKILDKS